MVENDIGHWLNPSIFEGLDGLKIIFFEAIFGANRSFLVELAQIKEVIDPVPNVIVRSSFKGRWHPDFTNAQIC